MANKFTPQLLVTATNTNTNYIGYWEHIAWAYKKVFDIDSVTSFVYTTKAEYDEWMPKLEKHGNAVYPLKAVEGIDSGNQAKLSRLYIASKHHPDTLCTINDMDLLPLNSTWYTEKIQKNFTNKDQILCIGSECYANTADRGKFPMGFLTGYGSTLGEIINPQNLDWQEYIQQFVGMADIDAKEDVSKKWYEFSDESVLRAMLKRWNQPDREVRVTRWGNNGNAVRFDYMVCRATMHKFDPVKLANNQYVFYHCSHPYDYDKIKDFLAYIDNVFN